jgi:hypothetical protein
MSVSTITEPCTLDDRAVETARGPSRARHPIRRRTREAPRGGGPGHGPSPTGEDDPMSFHEPDDERPLDPDDPSRAAEPGVAAGPTGLYPRERWLWFEQLWSDVCMMRCRYQLPVRNRWWESALQVEALAALAAWVERYDSGAWDDPPGKLALLHDLEPLLLDGHDPFALNHDRLPFARHLIDIGCQPPPVVWTPAWLPLQAACFSGWS